MIAAVYPRPKHSRKENPKAETVPAADPEGATPDIFGLFRKHLRIVRSCAEVLEAMECKDQAEKEIQIYLHRYIK